MRYIADSDGYVKEVSFGADIVCDGQVCTEYTGAVPTGYASLEAWFMEEIEKLYRWKIVSGNLTLDSSAVAPSDKTPAEILAGLGGVSIKKLWQNASPTSAFASQTFTVDMSSVEADDLILFDFVFTTSYQRHTSAIARAGDSVQFMANYVFANSGKFLGAYRTFTVKRTANSVTVSSGWQTTGTTDVQVDANCIPFAIYVIKGAS